MSHYNLIADSTPEFITAGTEKKVARRLFASHNNQDKFVFDSADYFREMDQKKKENEEEHRIMCLLNPPMIKKKFPLIKGQYSKKKFDSADYFLEIYQGSEGARNWAG